MADHPRDFRVWTEGQVCKSRQQQSEVQCYLPSSGSYGLYAVYKGKPTWNASRRSGLWSSPVPYERIEGISRVTKAQL